MKNPRKLTSIGLDFIEHDVFPPEADIIPALQDIPLPGR